MTVPPGRDERSARDRLLADVPIEAYIQKYGVEHPVVIDSLRKYPTLVYLLGRVTPEPVGRGAVDFDRIERDVRYVQEGSAMFGLEHRDDAMRWKGILNHEVGTARRVYYVARRMQKLTTDERSRFEEAGFDFAEFDTLDPAFLRDFMLVSHPTRRGWDERRLYELDDQAHLPGTPGESALQFFIRESAPEIFQRLIRVEDHAGHLAVEGPRGHHFPNAIDGILTWCDWTYGQRPVELGPRFVALREARKDIPGELLDILEASGRNFEATVNEVLQTNLYQEMQEAPPEPWELEVRRAYVAPSGITIAEAFPFYVGDEYPGIEAS